MGRILSNWLWSLETIMHVTPWVVVVHYYLLLTFIIINYSTISTRLNCQINQFHMAMTSIASTGTERLCFFSGDSLMFKITKPLEIDLLGWLSSKGLPRFSKWARTKCKPKADAGQRGRSCKPDGSRCGNPDTAGVLGQAPQPLAG